MNFKEMLKCMPYEERIELINEQIQYCEGLKSKKYNNNHKLSLQCIDDQIDYYKKVLETIKIWN